MGPGKPSLVLRQLCSLKRGPSWSPGRRVQERKKNKRYMVVSENGGAPISTLIYYSHIMGTPKKVPLNLVNPPHRERRERERAGRTKTFYAFVFTPTGMPQSIARRNAVAPDTSPYAQTADLERLDPAKPFTLNPETTTARNSCHLSIIILEEKRQPILIELLSCHLLSASRAVLVKSSGLQHTSARGQQN